MKRVHMITGVLAAVSLVALGAAGAGIALAPTPQPPKEAPTPPPVISREVSLGSDGALSVEFVGDTMLGDAAQPLIERFGYDWPLRFARESVTADFTVAVAEAPISTIALPWDLEKEYSYSTRPEAAAAMARAGIDAVTLANNHAFDVGPVGLADTIGHAEAAGIATFGAGPDISRAEQPLLVRTSLGTIGIVGMGESFGNRASSGTPGTVELSPDTIAEGFEIAQAAGADWVIADVHWGDNYTGINGEQRFWAQQFADAGYDLVVGSGPHFTQPIEFIDTMPVIYSVGNFVFGSPGRFDQDLVPGLGLAAGVELRPDGTTRLSVRCLLTDNDVVAFQPRPCTPAEARDFLPSLNPELTVQDDVGTLPCSCFTRNEEE